MTSVPDQDQESPVRRGRIAPKLPAVNMTGLERVIRVMAGVLLTAAGTWTIGSYTDGAAEVAAWVLLAVAVADLVVSGLVGYCPVYRFVPAPGRGRTTS